MDSDPRLLKVVSGVHTGAVAALPGDGIAIVGSAADCDIRLFDPDVAARHIAVSGNGQELQLRSMEGCCAVNGCELDIGSSTQVGHGDNIRLGESGVALSIHDAVLSDVDEPETIAASKSSYRQQSVPVAVVVLLLLALSGASILTPNASPAEPRVELGQIITNLGASGEIALSEQDGVILIDGIVAEHVYGQLQDALSVLEFDFVDKTRSTTLLLEQVRSVFRTNGYHVELAYEGDGVVQVQNLDESNPQVQQVTARVKNDVPGVAALEFLEIADAGRNTDVVRYPTDPDKRLTTIIDGDMAYVATRDGGRYFVGAILPGGFLLKRITVDGIQVDDDGEIRWLKL